VNETTTQEIVALKVAGQSTVKLERALARREKRLRKRRIAHLNGLIGENAERFRLVAAWMRYTGRVLECEEFEAALSELEWAASMIARVEELEAGKQEAEA
jgi:hypothetical protein